MIPLLVVEAAAPAGGVSVFGEAVGEVVVQHVSQTPWDSLPGHDEDDNDSVLAVVAGALPHQTQQLLLLAAATDHLAGQSAWFHFFFSNLQLARIHTVLVLKRQLCQNTAESFHLQQLLLKQLSSSFDTKCRVTHLKKNNSFLTFVFK